MKHVLRRLARAPLFTFLTLLTLAVGIGANSAIFSVINGVLLKPLPYADPDRLVGVWLTAPGIGMKDANASPSMYFTFREQNRTYQDIGLWNMGRVTVTGTGTPEEIPALWVTDGTLGVLGVQPVLGRFFTPQDDKDGAPETVVLTYGYWQQRFGGDPHVIGRRILIDGHGDEILGVLPQDFRSIAGHPSLVLPERFNRGKLFVGNFSYQAVARLKPGVTLAAANADVARMIPIMMRSWPMPPGIDQALFDNARIGPNVRPLKVDVVGDIGSVLWVLMGTIGIVLFIAVANVANLLLVRAEGRQQELAIRAALGAGWPQIARELLNESVTLGIAGGLLGLTLAYAGLKVLIAKSPASLPRLDEITIDPAVLLFTLAISVISGVLFGLIPVFKYSGPGLNLALREGGRTLSDGRERHRARSVLVVVQVALALVLLISSGLMIRTFQATRQVQPGFTHPDQLLTLNVFIPHAQVADPERVIRMHNDILDKLATIPGVSSAAAVSSVGLDGGENDPLFTEDHPEEGSNIKVLRRHKYVGPGYFHTVGNPLLAGRDLTWTDIYHYSRYALISENLARELWGSPSAALGKRIRETQTSPWWEIIGVTGDVRDDGLVKKAPGIVYWPILRKKFWGEEVQEDRRLTYVIRSSRAGTSSLFDQVQQAIWSVNPNVPLADVRTMQDIYDRSMARTSFTLAILAIAAAMALLLGVVGIYGVISYSVSQRTREIGIRMALGAQQGQVWQMFVRHGLVLTGIGVACGLVAAYAATRLMSSLLFGVSPVDPVTYLAVSGVLCAAALLASYLPARRATGIDPVECLRAD